MSRYCSSVLLLATLAGGLGLAGCTRDVNPVRDAMVHIGAGAKVPPAPDFVTRTRTSGQDEYIPVGIRQPPRRYQARTPEQIKRVEGQLDAVRSGAEYRGEALRREGQASQ